MLYTTPPFLVRAFHGPFTLSSLNSERFDSQRSFKIRHMEYVNLGTTGTKVSRICLGMMTYGSSTWREWVLEEEAS